jgi:uncharacterized protein (TIGR02284 family)
MDVKVAFSGDDLLATLKLCEFGEDNALKAYRTVLKKDNVNWPNGTREIIESQLESLKTSHDKIRALRDVQASVSKA